MSRTYEVEARWDSEAGVWVAESEDIPGLVTEAESLNALLEKIRVLVPELLS
jgi:predicted RNase H-like HicB family nuclease